MRPYRGPGNVPLRGRDVPMFAVVGGIATGLAFFVVTVVLNPDVAVAGVAWLALGLVALRRSTAAARASTSPPPHKVAIPQPVVDHEAEYDSVLVARSATLRAATRSRTAVKLAARRRRGIHVLVTITVPAPSPSTRRCPTPRPAARSIIEQAKLQGGRRVSGPLGEGPRRPSGPADHRRGAARCAPRAIVLPLPPRVAGGSLFGKTIETVLAERPCRVIIESRPQ